jgi:putative transposase
MAIPQRIHLPGTYFVTSRTYNHRSLFQVAANAELFLETLQHYRREGKYKLHDFVIMPDHIHLILTPQELALERVMQLIKGGFSRQLPSRFTLWQRGFTDHLIRDREDFLKHRAYLRDNPVRARLCQLPEQFPYSSACRNPNQTSGAEAHEE